VGNLLLSSGANTFNAGRLALVSTCGISSCSAFRQQTPNRLKTNFCDRRSKVTEFQSNSVGLFCNLASRTPLVSDVRSFATGDDKNDKDGGNAAESSELKGVVVHVPNPLSWMRNKWFSYLIRFTVDPAFSLDEFLTGAKQALSFLTRMIIQKDFEMLAAVASAEVVETVRNLVAPWTVEQQHSIEVLVEDITFINASIAAINKGKDSSNVLVDVLCIAVKRYKSKPLLVQMTVRFQRKYDKNTESDWFISNINEFVVREMNAAKNSDQQPK